MAKKQKPKVQTPVIPVLGSWQVASTAGAVASWGGQPAQPQRLAAPTPKKGRR